MPLQPKPIRPYSWRSLPTRITLLTLSVFLLGLWSLSWYAVRALHHDVQHLLSQQQLSTVTLQADELNRTLAARLQTLQDAGQLAAPLMAGSQADLQTFLATRLTLIKFFNGSLTVVGSDGQARAAYPSLAPGRALPDRERAAADIALKEGRAVIGQPTLSPQTRTPVVPFSAPIRDNAGQVLGALVGVIDLGKPNFLTPLLSSRYGQTGSYMLLAHPHRLLVAGTGQVQMQSDFPAAGVNPALDYFAQGSKGSAVLQDTQGQTVLASAVLLPLTGWSLVASLPSAEAFAPVSNLVKNILLATALASLLATALTWWLLRRQLKPMHTAFQALLTQAGTGQTPQPLPQAGNDEVGQLINGFNYLLDTLAQRETALLTSESHTRQTLQKALAVTKKLERYQEAMDQHVLITLSDASGRITHANPRFCDISGYPLDELLQHDYRLLQSGVHPKDFFTNLYQNISQGKTWQGEVCNRAKDGHLFWLAMTVVPFMDEAGQPVECITLSTDITERMAGEAELQTYREHLEELVQQRTHDLHRAETQAQAAALYARSLIEASVDPLFTINPQGQITDVNEATEAITGIDRDELVQSAFSEFFTEPVQAHALYHKVIARGRVNDFPLTLRSLNGELTHLLFNASVYRDQEGQVLGVFAAAHDVSTLNAAREAANAANQAKSSFLANMSHEIRTPMNGVVGMVDMLQQTQLTDEQRRMLGTVHQSSLALLDILNDILDYSKIEAGKLAVESIPTQLREVVQGVVQLMQTAARAKGLELVLWVSPQLPTWVLSDPTRLRQVLLNLVGNAIKFTHSSAGTPGRVTVRVASGHRANGQPGLYLRISDNGIGIAPAALAKLFTPFTQADVSTARQFGGTGLGLSISQRLVELMGGRIKAHSEPGKGSEFTVELPLRQAPAADFPEAPQPTPIDPWHQPAPPTRPPPGDQAPLILIAEDNETNRDVLHEQLQLLGWSADVAVDGVQALAMWARGSYALLLTDCHMPNMDGFELTAAIRQLEPPGTRHPIIAVTANAMQGEADRCRAAGMDDYLSKPLRLQQLRLMLAKWLPGAADEAAPLVPPTPPDDDAPVWDSLALGEAVGSDLAMQQRLLGKYLVSARAQVASLRRAGQTQDLKALADLAHALKSASRTVGAMALGELCQQLETAAREHNAALSCELAARAPEAFLQAETKIAAALRFPA